MRLPSPKITRAKWTGGMTQAVECLLYNHEVLISNSGPTKRKRITKFRREEAIFSEGV
jgi:hypothetical protein